jgi:hypothetical protein
MEEDPFALVESMTIVAFATGCERGYVYVRGEYPLAIERVAGAIEAARARGFLGDRVLGTPFAFDMEVRRGAGAYICGEETALFNSIEGFRGEPRNKPPFPVRVRAVPPARPSSTTSRPSATRRSSCCAAAPRTPPSARRSRRGRSSSASPAAWRVRASTRCPSE